MTTTTFDPAAALVALADSLPAGRTAQFESKINEARQGTLSSAHAAMVLRQLGGMSSPAEGETYVAPRRGDGSGFGASKPAYTDQATDAQVRFLNSLRTERGSEPLTAEAAAKLTKKQASAEIDAWKLIPRPKREVVAAKAAPVELEAGIYRLEDKFYKVQKAVHGSGRMYAKVLVVDGPGSAHFEYATGAIRQLTPDHKISLEEAKQFGHVYGVCVSCGATLTDEKSIEAGIGPVCAKKL